MGSTMTVDVGEWLNEPTSYTYQWMIFPSEVIANATGASYVPSQPDLGKQVFCRVKAANGAGFAYADSAPVTIEAEDVAAPAVTRYVSPSGTGDGTSQASPAGFSSLNTMIEQAGPGGFVRLMPGTYLGKYNAVNRGGAQGSPVTIVGVEGLARPVLKLSGTDRGAYVFNVQDGADHLRWRGLDVQSPGIACWKITGVVTGMELDDIVGVDLRGLVYMATPANSTVPEPGLADFHFHDVTLTGFTRGQFTLRNASYGVIERVWADSQGRNGDPITVLTGFDGDSHHVDVIDCVMLNSFDDRGAAWTGSISGDEMTVTAVSRGSVANNITVFDAGHTGYGTVTAQISGTTGKAGVYRLSQSGSAASAALHGGNPKLYWNADAYSTEGSTYAIRFIRCRGDGAADAIFDLKGGGGDSPRTPHQIINCEAYNAKRPVRCGNSPSGLGTSVIIDGLKINAPVFIPNEDGVVQSASPGGRAKLWVYKETTVAIRGFTVDGVPLQMADITQDSGSAFVSFYS